jgi:hypothetical protein
MMYYRYDNADMTIRTQDAAQNLWGWNDLACSTPLPIICAVSCKALSAPAKS